jgi:sarcosine oxidase subunit gamma
MRLSPVHAQLATLQPQWEDRLGMRTAMRVGGDDAAKLDAVALADVSFLKKVGLKGPNAQQWLADINISPPANANNWAPLPGAGVIARLGRTEFFIEDGVAGDKAEAIRSALGSGAEGVYPVIRQDAGLVLVGRRVNELLVETCNVNFAEINPQQQIVVMTQMIGVTILAIRTDYQDIPYYRIWCDPTFAPYFWETLAEIAGELGGGIIGAGSLPGQAGKTTP